MTIFLKESWSDTNVKNPSSLVIDGTTLFVGIRNGAGGPGGLAIIDASDPSALVLLGRVSGAGSNEISSGVGYKSSTSRAYTAQYSNTVSRYNVSSFTAPSLLSSSAQGSPVDAVLVGNYFYVNCFQASRTVETWDVSAGGLTFVGSVGIGTLDGRGICHVGSYLFTMVADNRFSVWDISTPSSPSLVASVIDATNLSNPFHVTAAGSYAVVVGVRGSAGYATVIDISTPTAPVVVGTVNVPAHFCEGVCVDGMKAIAVGGTGVTIIDFSTPSAPVVVETLAIGATASLHRVAGTLASFYVVEQGVTSSDSGAVHSLSGIEPLIGHFGLDTV